MTGEEVVAEMVRAWAGRRFPDDPDAVDLAVLVAERSYRDGAPVSEACQRAMDVLTSRSLHPSKGPRPPAKPDRLAS